MDRSSLLADLANGYRVFAALGWGDLGDGHISARDPERPDCFWLLRFGQPFSRATPQDFVLIGPNGDLVEGEGRVNHAGFCIHQPILAARADIVSAAHTHTQWGTPFSAEARNVQPITQEACLFHDDCVLFDDEEVQIRSVEGGIRIAQTLGRCHATILRNHGLLTVGDSIAASVARFVFLERVAEAHLKAVNAQPISGEEADLAKEDLIGSTHWRDSFDALVFHHLDDPVRGLDA